MNTTESKPATFEIEIDAFDQLLVSWEGPNGYPNCLRIAHAGQPTPTREQIINFIGQQNARNLELAEAEVRRAESHKMARAARAGARKNNPPWARF